MGILLAPRAMTDENGLTANRNGKSRYNEDRPHGSLGGLSPNEFVGNTGYNAANGIVIVMGTK